MTCRQETVAEGDRVKSTEELHCAAFDTHLIGVDPDYGVYVDKNHLDSRLPGTGI